MNFSKNIPSAIISAFLFLIMAFSIQVQAQDFEGVIHYQFAEAQNPNMSNIAYMIKGDNIRMELSDNNQMGSILYLPGESKFVIIMESMKSYMSVDTDKMDSKTNGYSGKWEDSEMTETGTTKIIAGHSCEVWKVTGSSGETLSMCVAKDLGTFMSPGNPMAKKSAPDWAKKVIAEGYMPLEVIEETNGSKKVQMKATKIEEKSLSPDLFTIPDGYKDMSSMMRQMMNRQRN